MNGKSILKLSLVFSIVFGSFIGKTGLAATEYVNACGTLSGSNTTFVLEKDVYSDGGCFYLEGSNITLDLNGHVITYDNFQNTGLPNSDFEIGNSDVPSDWDISQAPTFERRSNRYYPMVGQWHLNIGRANNGEKIISPWTYLPPNSKAAVYNVRGDSSSAYRSGYSPVFNLTVEYQDGSKVVSQNFDNLAEDNLIQFTTKPTSGKYRAIFSVIDNKGYVSDWGALPTIDLFDLRPSENYGIRVKDKSSNVTIKNGKIIQGSGQSFRGHGIYFYDGNGLNVSGINFENYGFEAQTVFTNYVQNITLENNVVKNRSPYKLNRHEARGAFSSLGGGANYKVSGNVMDCGSGWGCIFSYMTGNVEINGNDLKTSTAVTNHFAVVVGSSQGYDVSGSFKIYENDIESQGNPAGGGIAVNLNGAEVYRNSIKLTKVNPNFEYGEGDGGYAIILKDYFNVNGCEDIKIYENDITLIGDFDDIYDGSSKYGKGYMTGLMNMCTRGGVEFYDNRIKASVVKPGVIVTGIQPGGRYDYSTSTYTNNTIESDSRIVDLGGYASDGFDLSAPWKFISNTFIKGSNPQDFHTLEGARLTQMTSGNSHFIDTRLGSGVDLKDTTPGGYKINYLVEWYLNISVKDSAGKGLGNASVSIKDKNGTSVYQGNTNQSGTISNIVLKELRNTGTGSNPTDTSYLPFEVSISSPDGTTGSVSVLMNTSKNLDYKGGAITITNANGDVNPDRTPPSLNDLNPAGVLSAGTSETTLSVSTNEKASCRYSENSGVVYSSMQKNFTSSNGLSHQYEISGLENGKTYRFYVKCIDENGNANISDALISFSIGGVSRKFTIEDFGDLVMDWLKKNQNSPADINMDNEVDSRDLGIMMSNWQSEAE